jgi:hypothetical protein
MSHSRLAPAIITLLGFATLPACDSEHDPDAELYEALDDEPDALLDIDNPPVDPDTLELLDPVTEQPYNLSNCLIADKIQVLANNSDRGTVNLQIGPGVAWMNGYDFEVTPVAFFDELGDWWIRKTPQAGGTLVARDGYPGWHAFNTGSGDTFTFEMLATYGNPTPGWVYDNVVTLQGNGVYCSLLIQLRIPDCTSVGWWSTNPWPTPWFDNANCFVASPPPGHQSFIYNNSWYLKPYNGNQCAMGVYDNANCYVGSAPGGHTAFIYNGSFYFTP